MVSIVGPTSVPRSRSGYDLRGIDSIFARGRRAAPVAPRAQEGENHFLQRYLLERAVLPRNIDHFDAGDVDELWDWLCSILRARWATDGPEAARHNMVRQRRGEMHDIKDGTPGSDKQNIRMLHRRAHGCPAHYPTTASVACREGDFAKPSQHNKHHSDAD
jgi:hypothetical protein